MIAKVYPLVIILCLFAVSSGFNIQVDDSQKVKIDYYFQSECNACRLFINGSFKIAANTKVDLWSIQDFWRICEINLYPYGNAKRKFNGTSWHFTCQHGKEECRGNLIESCALKIYDKYTKALPYLLCLESDYPDWEVMGKKCAVRTGLDWNRIDKCASSKEGTEYLLEIAKATESLSPPHSYVPWIVIDGKHDEASQTALTKNMLKYVCGAYRGSEKIQACEGI